MKKLHAQVVYSWIIVFLCKIGVKWYCCCCFVDETNWFCCGYKMLLLMIHAMSFTNYEDCDEIWTVFESFVKNGWICDLCWKNVFDSNFIWFWMSFYVYKRLDKLWEPIWALGNQKLGFWGKNGVFPESWVADFCHN